MKRSTPLVASLAFAAASTTPLATAQTASSASAPPAITGEATAQPSTPVQPQVTVVSREPDSVVGEYKIDFAALDKNHDGSLSRAEVKSNPTLTAEFDAVDIDHNGRLSKKELEGWM